MEDYNLSCSIVTFHTPENELLKLLSCVLASSVELVYVIDNSLNDSLRVLCNSMDKVIYIHNANLGYGAGHNIAIRKAIEKKMHYHIVINPDVVFDSHVLDVLLDYMNTHQDVGLVMPKILYPNGEVQFLCKLLPTPMDLIIRRFFSVKGHGNSSNYNYELRFTGYDKEMVVPSLSGCFMFMRCSILEKIGGFDERFFMYAEDLDLCRRIGQVSKTVFYPKVFIFHAYEKGSYKNVKLLRYHIVSIVKYFNKWGWLFDRERRVVNKKAMAILKSQFR